MMRPDKVSVFVRSVRCLQCGLKRSLQRKAGDISVRALVSALCVVHDGNYSDVLHRDPA